MGNQFGVAHRTPIFGKGWSFVKERRKSKEKSKSIQESNLRRPNSTAGFFRIRDSASLAEDVQDEATFQEIGALALDQGVGVGSGSTPKVIKRIPRSKSMRCSPTVPDALTLTLGAVNNVVIGASGVAAATVGNVNANAVANALDALKKLTPAAPGLFREPSFDDFFEEAERRNQTMEALHAVLIAPSSSTTSIAATQTSRASSSNTFERCSTPTREVVLIEPLESGASPITVQPPTPPSRKKSPALSTGHSKSKELVQQRSVTLASSTDDEDDAFANRKISDTLLNPNSKAKGRVLVIVGGRSDESLNIDRWDRSPPTIIVQPETSFATGAADSSSTGCLNASQNQRPRPTLNASLSSAPLGVRFADEIHDDSPAPVQMRPKDSRLARRRSSIRRKTIGGIVNLSNAAETSKIGSQAPERTMDDATVSLSVLSPSQPVRSTSQRSLSKKNFSKSDVTLSPPIISLLTQPQIILIRQVWQQLYISKGPTVLGSHIFQRVTFKNSQARQVFRKADVGNQCFNVDIMYKSHAKIVATILDEVIRNLEDLQVVDSKLVDVGRRHAVFHDLGFHANFWSTFAEAFIDCTLEWGEKNRRVEEARKAWAIIIAHITDRMKLGYQEARRNCLPQRNSPRKIRVNESDSFLRCPTLEQGPTCPFDLAFNSA